MHVTKSYFLFTRYWLFSDVVPGLYIEKGWVPESINYSYTPPPQDKADEQEEEEEDDDGEPCIPTVGGLIPLLTLLVVIFACGHYYFLWFV